MLGLCVLLYSRLSLRFSLMRPRMVQALQEIDSFYKQNRTDKQEGKTIFLKRDRDQTEVFSTSNYSGYVTECRGSLSNQNFVYLIQIISGFFLTFTY